MSFRDRLLFVFIPLVVLPLVLHTFFSLFILKQAGISELERYEILSVAFVVCVLVAAVIIVRGASQAISKPLFHLIEKTRQIVGDNFETVAKPHYQTAELDILAQAIEKLKNDIKHHQDLLQQQAAHAAVGKVVSHVAHDLASPLSSMQAALRYFRQLNLDDPLSHDYVNLLELGTTRLRAVSKELLDMHKGEAPTKILFSLHKLLDELIGEYQANIDHAAVSFTKNYSSQAMSLHADRAKIQRVFGNLIKNAIEAMDKVGHLTVHVKSENGHAIIQIEDDGCGMPPEILNRVLHGGVSHGKSNGHGIGMKVVSDTIAGNHGRLDVKSEVGIGTVFTVHLPLPESVQIKDVAREEGIVERFTIHLQPDEPLLVIDDSVELLEQWRLEMEQKGYATLSCTCYEEFMEKDLGSRLTKTAVVDYHFANSELKGTEVIQKLREQGFQNLYLCTAEYWKPSVHKEVEKLGVTICPKPLPKVVVGGVIASPQGVAIQSNANEIATSPSAPPQNDNGGRTVLLIDDDDAIRLTWSAIRKQLGVATLHSFPSLEAAIQAKVNLSACDLCIIDKNIPGSDYDGARMLDYLKQNGAKKVILATGEQERDIRKDPQFDALDGITAEKIPMSLEKYWN